MRLIHFLSLLTFAWAAVPQFDSPVDDCCSLTWEPVIEEGGRRFFPASAIPFTTANDYSPIYYARKSDLNQPHVGAIDDRVSSPLYVLLLATKAVLLPGWLNTYVLSNPNNCELEWRTVLNFNSSFSHEFPTVDDFFFASAPSGFVGARPRVSNDTNSHGLMIVNMSPSYFWQDRAKILSVDCAASLRKTMSAELFDIEFDPKALVDGGLKVLTWTEVINDSDFDQEVTVNLQSEVSYSLSISHDAKLYSMMNTKWGARSSEKLRWLGKVIGIKDLMNNPLSLKDNFTRKGEVSFDSEQKKFEYQQTILVKARSKTKVSMNTQPISGSQKFTAHYKIRSTKKNATVTLNQVSKSLRRQGLAGLENLKQDDKGNIIFTVDGEMDVDGGIDTHIFIESIGIGNNSASLNSTRIVRGLDQLSLPSIA